MTKSQFWQEVFLQMIRNGKSAGDAKRAADLAAKGMPKK